MRQKKIKSNAPGTRWSNSLLPSSLPLAVTSFISFCLLLPPLTFYPRHASTLAQPPARKHTRRVRTQRMRERERAREAGHRVDNLHYSPVHAPRATATSFSSASLPVSGTLHPLCVIIMALRSRTRPRATTPPTWLVIISSRAASFNFGSLRRRAFFLNFNLGLEWHYSAAGALRWTRTRARAKAF